MKKKVSPRDDLDTIYSWYIRLKETDYNGFVNCFTCNNKKHWTELQCGHYVSRKYLSTRFYEKNTHPQCVGCNIFLHGNMEEYALKLTKKYGIKILKELNKLKQKELHLSRDNYVVLINKYAKKIQKIVIEKDLYFDFSKLNKILNYYK